MNYPRTIRARYGSGNTLADVYVYPQRDGSAWYAIHGSLNVNQAPDDDELQDGVNVEEIADIDTSTAAHEITSEEALQEHVDGADTFEQYDDGEYDVEAMRTDAANGNFSEDRAEEYRHTHIVAESIVNGQYEQAREQCQRYGLSYEQQMVANGRDPWK